MSVRQLFTPCLGAIGLLAVAVPGHAAVTSTWTAASDYDFRGITQTAQDPALQVSLDYANDAGWYVGAWASNVDFCASGSACADADYEVDLYSGFTGTFGEAGPGWDVGLIYYTYEKSVYNYPEIYASLSQGWFKGKVWYSNDFGGDTTSGDTPAFYLDGGATIPLPRNFSVLAHVGYSAGDYWDDLDAAGTGRKYFDYSIGVGYTLQRFNIAVKWVDGSDLRESDGAREDVFSSEARVVLSVATTFPWK